MLLKALAERGRDERGVYAILFAILVVVLFTMVAIGVDLSDARAEVRANQSRSDFAALAAGSHLPSDPLAACNAAWSYLVSNTPGLPAGATSPCSSGVPQAFNPACTATAVEYEATGEEPYDIVFVFPVPDSHPLITDGVLDAEVDGDPCERFGVIVRTERSPLFGGILGSSGINAPASAVIRGFEGTQQSKAVALLLLDPSACDALIASGQAEVHVFSHDADNPGRITVDSIGLKNDNPNTCTSGTNRFTIDATGTQNSRIKACGNAFLPADPTRCDPGGMIELFAMTPGQATCLPSAQNHACDPADLSDGRMFPVPIRSTSRVTRSPVDHEWDCKEDPPGYPDYEPYGPSWSVPVDECTAGTPDYITDLETFIGPTSTLPPFPDQVIGGVPYSSYNFWYLANGNNTTGFNPCSPAPGTVVPVGNWWVNCTSNSGFNVNLSAGERVTFLGGNIVFQRHVQVNGGELFINTGDALDGNPVDLPLSCRRPDPLCSLEYSQKAAYVYLRTDGELSKGAQGRIDFRHTAVIINNGRVDVGGGGQPLRWTAPHQIGSPLADDPASPFDKLSLWSESTLLHGLGGGLGSLEIEGVFFTPNAQFNYAGQANQFLDRAQFLTFRMSVSGQGVLRMQPDPDFTLLIPRSGVYLIR